jgi:F-type H+-transporting ATPase subunit b
MEILKTLGINGWDFTLHTINFIVLVFLLTKFLYRPVVSMLDERSRTIRDSMEQAERVRKEAEQAESERATMLADARREIQEMMTRATQTAERIQADARADAQLQAQRIIERAQQEAAAERAQSMSDLRREVAGLAVMAAERIINKNLDDATQRQLVDDFLAERGSS